jgi:hypothetical protein
LKVKDQWYYVGERKEVARNKTGQAVVRKNRFESFCHCLAENENSANRRGQKRGTTEIIVLYL